MADYGSYPLWREGPSGVTNIAPEMIHLPDDLAVALRSWAAEYDLTLNSEDPLLSGFADAEDEQAFNSRGLALAHAVAAALGPGAEVTYFDSIKSVLVRVTD